MIINAKNVYIGGGGNGMKKNLLGRALKKKGKDLDNDMQEEEDTPVMKKLSLIADTLKSKRSATHHPGGG